MKLRIALAGLLLGLLPGLAWTQAAPQPPAETQPAAAPKIDPPKEADIRRLLDLVGAKKVMNQVTEQMIASIKPIFAHALPPGERTEKIIDTLFQKLRTRMTSGELLELLIPVYDKYLSDDDLKALIQFYQSTAGEHWTQASPQILQESYTIGIHWGQKTFQEVLQEMEEEFPKLKQLGKPAAEHP